VEAVVKVTKTSPKCEVLQGSACAVLGNLASCKLGQEKAIESCGIEAVHTAVSNHLDSAKVCEYACCALVNIASGSKEHTKVLISLGGAATVANVRKSGRLTLMFKDGYCA
jgi:hypothetical protein